MPTSQSTMSVATSVQSMNLGLPGHGTLFPANPFRSESSTSGPHGTSWTNVNVLLLTSLLAVRPDQMVELDLTRTESLRSYENVRIAESGLALGPLAGKWIEMFRGRSDFGLLTGVYWMRDRLFFLDSPLPAGSDGGDVYMWDKGKPKKVLEVREQGVVYMRGNGGKLFIPGADSTEAWDFGNIYRSLDGGITWSKFRSVPRAVHIWDMAHWRGKMYVSTGSLKDKAGYGAVLESSDGGKSWRETLIAYPPDRKKQFARCYSLIPLRDGLYASFAVVDNDAKKPGPKSSFDFYRFDGKKWTALKLFSEAQRTPYFGLRHRDFQKYALVGTSTGGYMLSDGQIEAIDGLEGKIVFDFERVGKEEMVAVATDPKTKLSAVYLSSLPELIDGTGRFDKAYSLPAGQEGLTIRTAMGRLLVGTRATGGGRLLAEANAPSGIAVTVPIKITNEGKLTVKWTGEQPAGTVLQFQVHSSRSEADLQRMTVWPRAREGAAPASFDITGVPKGLVFLQIRVVLRGGDLISPSLRSIRIESKR